MNADDARKKAGRRCYNWNCDREAQHNGNHNGDKHGKGGWSPYWCRECDTQRIMRLSKSLAEFAKDFNLGHKQNRS